MVIKLGNDDKLRFVYLAQPIDFNDVCTRDLEDALKTELTQVGMGLYSPKSAWTVGEKTQPGPEIAVVNRLAAWKCDAMVAVLMGGPTLGVPVEVDRAMRDGKSVVLVTSRWLLNVSWTIAGEWATRSNVLVVDWSSTTWTAKDVAVKCVGWLLGRKKAEDRDAAPVMRWMKTREGGEEPRQKYSEDAGWDLVCCEDVAVGAGEWANIPAGIAVELPESTWGMITGRSSSLATRKLLVPTAVIDQGYRGELHVSVWNLSDKAQVVYKGDRVGQLIVVPRAWSAETGWAQASALGGSLRGTEGFGSTGR